MRIYSNHFKRKMKKKLHENMLIIILSIILICLVINLYNKDKVETTKAQETINTDIIEDKLTNTTLLAEADITKAVLEAKTSVSERFVSQINSEIEYIALTENGKEAISHNRSKESDGLWQKYFDKSEITIGFDYNAILSIKTSDISITSTDGIIYINYGLNDIYIKGIDIYNTVCQTEKGVFGKSYTDKEVLGLLDIAKSNLSLQISNDNSLKDKSEKNLNTYFIDIANKLNITKLYINNEAVIDKGYVFLSPGTVKFNHPFEPLQSQDYIVIHSTACPDIDAMEFYNRLNIAQTKRGTSCHFYVDDKNVVQAIATDLKSYNCGINNKIPCDNNSSISLEICEFSDPVRQQKAIENASDFVKSILVKQFPKAAILMHRDIDRTACPQILTDEQFNTYFSNN